MSSASASCVSGYMVKRKERLVPEFARRRALHGALRPVARFSNFLRGPEGTSTAPEWSAVRRKFCEITGSCSVCANRERCEATCWEPGMMKPMTRWVCSSVHMAIWRRALSLTLAVYMTTRRKKPRLATLRLCSSTVRPSTRRKNVSWASKMAPTK